MTVKQAAVRLMISPATVYALIAARKIRHERHGLRRGAIRISEEALADYRARCTVDAEGQPAEEPVPVSEPSGAPTKGPGIELW